MSKKKEAVVEEWRRLIVECENRPKGVKFGDWCKSVGVSKTNYYYWKKRLRELESDTPQIVKVEADELVSEEGFIEVESGNARIRVTDNTPMELLRKGIDSLAAIIAERSELKPFVPDTLYLFCGRRHNKI